MTKSRHRSTIYTILISAAFALIACPLQASDPWQKLNQTIQNHLNPGNHVVGYVTLIQGPTAIINLQDPRITIGTTLAVKGNTLPGVPLPLQDNIARIRVTQVNGNQARGTILRGSQNIPPGVPLFPLGHNRVYLYSNLVAPQNLLPYQDLTRTLQQNRTPYAIKTWAQIAVGDTPGIRPLIIVFEAQRNQITCRLTDREQNVFLQSSFTLNFAPPTNRQAGTTWSQPTAYSFTPTGSTNSNQSFTKATGPAPGTRAAGKIRLKNPYKRLIFADCNKKPGQELVLLNKNYLEIYQLNNLKITPLSRYRLPHNDNIPLHLHAGDFNNNGKDELYITLGRPIIVDEKNDTLLSSMIIEFDGKTPRLLGKDYPYYFRVIEQRDDNQVLMVQKMGRFKQYEVPIRWGGFYNGKFKVKNVYGKSNDVFSLYNFNLSPFDKNHLLIIDEEGNIAGFNGKTSERLITADNQYGIFDETTYYQKLDNIEYEGGFTVKKTAVPRLSARRFIKRNSYGNQIFLIKKRRVVNPTLFEEGLELIADETIKHDQIIGLQWRNGEIRESWKSPKFPRDIVDFGFTKENGKEIMVVLTRNKDEKYALELLH